ncbi:hypothetical protein WJX73_010818 [Symbiochloris irregularis]|uniref:Nitric oxide synthase-interacting protein zinc-finger domain-containing protein n=1 Tax=Symbiochloris irregularis TaxID=706552 RepID=A0AAW1P172_9CHLO
MGRGSRHSKNAGTMGSEAQTYRERSALGFGTVRERLGKDAVGNFYDCRLTLQAAVDPVCTPDGYLYSKEAIVENLAAQKKATKRKLAVYLQQQEEIQQKATERAAVAEQTQLLAFDRQNHMGASTASARNLSTAIQEEAEAMLTDKRVVSTDVAIQENKEKMKEMKAFWVPSKTPEARALVEQPDAQTRCPASGRPLRFKDLIAVNFSKPPPDQNDSAWAVDPISKDGLTNAHKLVVLKPTGDVMQRDSYDSCVKPDGVYNGFKIRPKDVVELRRGGTGFALHDGQSTQASKFFALGPGSGRQDLRGQHQGARSAGGLVFNN